MSVSDVDFFEVTLSSSSNLFEVSEAEEMFSYWKSFSRNAALPVWKDLDVIDIPGVIPNLILIEVRGDPPTFAAILTGTTVVQEVGEDSTNHQLHEQAGVEEVSRRLEEVIKARCGYFVSNTPVTWASNHYKKHSALVLPCTDEDGTITHLMCWVGDFC